MLAACLAVAAIFGVTPVINKYILQSISVEQLVVMSGLLFGLASVVYGSYRGLWPSIRNVGGETWSLVAVSAALIFVVANYLYLTAIRDGKTYLAAAITASYPLVTAICGYLLFRETVTVQHLVGIGLVVGGVVALS